jgi:hypothetical protein
VTEQVAKIIPYGHLFWLLSPQRHIHERCKASLPMKQHLKKPEIIFQLETQLEKIATFADIYDTGNKSIAQEIAVKLRVIFHNTNKSKSLLAQLKLDHIPFVDTAKKFESNNILSHWGLIAAESTLGDGGGGTWQYVPTLNNAESRLVPFDNWWDSKKVIADGKRNVFTRRKLVLEVSDTDGGAHVDEALKEDYHDLTRKNSLGWFQNRDGEEGRPLNDPVPPSIRQIAFETLATFSRINLKTESRLR